MALSALLFWPFPLFENYIGEKAPFNLEFRLVLFSFDDDPFEKFE